jgi:predicted TIM-barrel fold metal-dependent hydrolase
MSEPVKIDVHMHLYPSTAVGDWWKAGYEIWEYGEKPDVRLSVASGTIGEALEAIEKAGFSHGIGVNLFSVELFRLEAIAMLPPELDPEERERAVAEIEGGMPDIRAFNRWLCDALEPIPELTPFVAADPWALPADQMVEHLEEAAGWGARGIKLHPVVQKFAPNDPRMHSIYRACTELGLTALSHTGPARTDEPYAEPANFAEMLRDFPDLTVVLAHLGGGVWSQTADLAKAFPRTAFDLCEIIAWTGAPNAPTDENLARMIQEVGPERVLFGTDFPWYDLDVTAERVMDLPLLSREEKEAILGANAVRILGLPL